MTTREQWLSDKGLTEADVLQDEDGEFVMEYVEWEGHESGGAFDREVRLPEEIQSN